MVLLLLLFLVSSVAGVELLPPDDEFCLGSIANWTCTVNGSAIGWVYNVHSRFYTANNASVLPLGSSPFITGPTSIYDDVSTSMATANLSSNALNGTILECSDGGTNSANVSLNLKDSQAATSVEVRFDEASGQISVTWSGAICVPYYRVVVNNAIEDTVTGTSFSYTPLSHGFYSFQINSIDYFGREIGCIANSTSYPWIPPTTMIKIKSTHSMGLYIKVSFQDNNLGQPPVNYCSITVNDNSTACQINETYTFPIMHGVNYTYNVTVCNVVGSISETGILRVPTTVSLNVTETITVSIFSVLVILIGFWIVLRICWKRQCCCPRIWRSSFWLIFFCYDCCTYDAEEKECKNPSSGGEMEANASL